MATKPRRGSTARFWPRSRVAAHQRCGRPASRGPIRDWVDAIAGDVASIEYGLLTRSDRWFAVHRRVRRSWYGLRAATVLNGRSIRWAKATKRGPTTVPGGRFRGVREAPEAPRLGAGARDIIASGTAARIRARPPAARLPPRGRRGCGGRHFARVPPLIHKDDLDALLGCLRPPPGLGGFLGLGWGHAQCEHAVNLVALAPLGPGADPALGGALYGPAVKGRRCRCVSDARRPARRRSRVRQYHVRGAARLNPPPGLLVDLFPGREVGRQ